MLRGVVNPDLIAKEKSLTVGALIRALYRYSNAETLCIRGCLIDEMSEGVDTGVDMTESRETELGFEAVKFWGLGGVEDATGDDGDVVWKVRMG